MMVNVSRTNYTLIGFAVIKLNEYGLNMTHRWALLCTSYSYRPHTHRTLPHQVILYVSSVKRSFNAAISFSFKFEAENCKNCKKTIFFLIFSEFFKYFYFIFVILSFISQILHIISTLFEELIQNLRYTHSKRLLNRALTHHFPRMNHLCSGSLGSFVPEFSLKTGVLDSIHGRTFQ